MSDTFKKEHKVTERLLQHSLKEGTRSGEWCNYILYWSHDINDYLGKGCYLRVTAEKFVPWMRLI